jgi:hypothetical protein
MMPLFSPKEPRFDPKPAQSRWSGLLLRLETLEWVLSRDLGWRAEALSFSRSLCCRGRSVPIGLRPKGAQSAAGNQMALKVEGVVGGGVYRDETLADPGDLKRCIFRPRRRSGWCETSARLFW